MICNSHVWGFRGPIKNKLHYQKMCTGFSWHVRLVTEHPTEQCWWVNILNRDIEDKCNPSGGSGISLKIYTSRLKKVACTNMMLNDL